MARLIKRDYVDKETKEIIQKGTAFNGSSEKLKKLIELGIVSEKWTGEELSKEQIKKLLDEKEVEYKTSANKEELLEVLNGTE